MNANRIAVKASMISKVYEIGDRKIKALKDVNLEVVKGEFVVVSGPSGSGKTTLLNIISGIDKPTSGLIAVFGETLMEKDESSLAAFRCANVGFVFQSYNLVSTLSVAENVAFPMEWTQKPEARITKRVDELLESLGLKHRVDHFPSQLSGGEQQRVAFARALANDPPLLLVDEPTGNLDAKTSQNIIQILQALKQNGKTMIVATHDERILNLANQKLYIEDGTLARMNE